MAAERVVSGVDTARAVIPYQHIPPRADRRGYFCALSSFPYPSFITRTATAPLGVCNTRRGNGSERLERAFHPASSLGVSPSVLTRRFTQRPHSAFHPASSLGVSPSILTRRVAGAESMKPYTITSPDNAINRLPTVMPLPAAAC